MIATMPRRLRTPTESLRRKLGITGVARMTTPVIYWSMPLSPIESTRESWLVFWH
jgi:hypothetical protein